MLNIGVKSQGNPKKAKWRPLKALKIDPISTTIEYFLPTHSFLARSSKIDWS